MQIGAALHSIPLASEQRVSTPRAVGTRQNRPPVCGTATMPPSGLAVLVSEAFPNRLHVVFAAQSRAPHRCGADETRPEHLPASSQTLGAILPWCAQVYARGLEARSPANISLCERCIIDMAAAVDLRVGRLSKR
jgi:hypothetical protein